MRIISGVFKNRRLLSPKSEAVRPTQERVREAIFSHIGEAIIGKTFLDLCAGSGAMGLEALSRGAAHAVFVEKDRKTLAILKQNIELLGLTSKTTLHLKESTLFLSKQKTGYDYIFFDPPYDRLDLYQEGLQLIDSQQLLSSEGVMFLEERLENPPALPVLSFLKKEETRRYGSTQITRYRAQKPVK
jgi:16S rRNA (guanine966-N2)-methyltransferase